MYGLRWIREAIYRCALSCWMLIIWVKSGSSKAAVHAECVGSAFFLIASNHHWGARQRWSVWLVLDLTKAKLTIRPYSLQTYQEFWADVLASLWSLWWTLSPSSLGSIGATHAEWVSMCSTVTFHRSARLMSSSTTSSSTGFIWGVSPSRRSQRTSSLISISTPNATTAGKELALTFIFNIWPYTQLSGRILLIHWSPFRWAWVLVVCCKFCHSSLCLLQLPVA